MSDNIENYKEENLILYKRIIDAYKTINNSTVRIRLISLLERLVNDQSVQVVIEDISNLVGSEKSAKVVLQGLIILNRLLLSNEIEHSQYERIYSLVTTLLPSKSYNVQRHSLFTLSIIIKGSSKFNDASLICKYCYSQDARVRAQALNSLLMIGLRNIKYCPILYAQAKIALKDDYECVRRAAIIVVFEIGLHYPDIEIVSDNLNLRLIDDAFETICTALCDLSTHVSTVSN